MSEPKEASGRVTIVTVDDVRQALVDELRAQAGIVGWPHDTSIEYIDIAADGRTATIDGGIDLHALAEAALKKAAGG